MAWPNKGVINTKRIKEIYLINPPPPPPPPLYGTNLPEEQLVFKQISLKVGLQVVEALQKMTSEFRVQIIGASIRK